MSDPEDHIAKLMDRCRISLKQNPDSTRTKACSKTQSYFHTLKSRESVPGSLRLFTFPEEGFIRDSSIKFASFKASSTLFYLFYLSINFLIFFYLISSKWQLCNATDKYILWFLCVYKSIEHYFDKDFKGRPNYTVNKIIFLRWISTEEYIHQILAGQEMLFE